MVLSWDEEVIRRTLWQQLPNPAESGLLAPNFSWIIYQLCHIKVTILKEPYTKQFGRGYS